MMGKHRLWAVVAFLGLMVAYVPITFAETVFLEDFDTAFPPSLPDDWELTYGPWGSSVRWITSQVAEENAPPHSPPNCLRLVADSIDGTSIHSLRRTVGADTRACSALTARLWIYLPRNKELSMENLSLGASTDGGMNWSSLGMITPNCIDMRLNKTYGWWQCLMNADDLVEYADVRLDIGGLSCGHSDVFLDDIELLDIPGGCFPDEATFGTVVRLCGLGFGNSPGRLWSPGQPQKMMRPISWTDTEIEFSVTEKIGCTGYRLVVQPNGGPPTYLPHCLNGREPQIIGIVPATADNGDVVQVTGKFFSIKRGKVVLVDDSAPKPIRRSCKLLSWSMDSRTNTSQAIFRVPKNLPAGTYDVVVKSSVGSGTSQDALRIN
jgi:hypothetical protein